MQFDREKAHKVKMYFDQMKDVDDLVALINAVNGVMHEKTHPLKSHHLKYHAFHAKTNYKTFSIPKKSGGERQITAPEKSLKNVQKTLNVILQCVYKPSLPAHGFVWNKSVVTNAQHHTRKNYVYNLDLKDFFPSIRKARIEKRLQFPPFNLGGDKSEIAILIARLVTHRVVVSEEDTTQNYAVLPQGAPTSPIISNAICEKLDRRLLGLAKRFGAKYTRYADDMTFSSMINIYEEEGEFVKELRRIIEEQYFEINPKKTRLQKRGYRQEVTGVIVNDKTNVSRRYVKQLRAMLYSIEKFGLKKAEKHFQKEYASQKGNVVQQAPKMLSVLHGKLNYLKMLKGDDDNTYKMLQTRYETVLHSLKEKASGKIISSIVETDIGSPRKKKTEKTDGNQEVRTPDGKSGCNTHNPRKLVELLKAFTTPGNPLKDTTHDDWSLHTEPRKYGSFDEFSRQLGKSWAEISSEVNVLSPNLQKKIWVYLRSSNLGEPKKDGAGVYTWGMHQIRFGWASPELKAWCDDGNEPLDFILPMEKQTKIGKKKVDRFIKVVDAFKNEIEIRTETDQLKKIFEDIELKMLADDFRVLYDRDNDLHGIDFYTDVQWFKKGLESIFKEIKKRHHHNELHIKAVRGDGFVEIIIIHKDSKPSRPRDEMIKEVETGDFSSVITSFCSLCDWSVEAAFVDGNYRINFLASDNEKKYESLDEAPLGFTHILRFYR